MCRSFDVTLELWLKILHTEYSSSKYIQESSVALVTKNAYPCHKPWAQCSMESDTSLITWRYVVLSCVVKLNSSASIYYVETRSLWPSTFLANVNSCSCSLYVVVRPSVVCLSVVCNVRAPYSGD